MFFFVIMGVCGGAWACGEIGIGSVIRGRNMMRWSCFAYTPVFTVSLVLGGCR